MEMKRIEAETLEEAYGKAAKELNCSVTQINYEIVQHPTAGMMGMFKKTAIIIAAKKTSSKAEELETKKKEIIEKEVVEEKVIKKEVVKEKVIENSSSEVKVKDNVIVDDFLTDNKKSKSIEKIW